jgi:hypothetical protein
MQNVEPGSLLIVALGCGVLCVIGIGLLFSLQIVTSLFGSLLGIFELFGNVFSGGPIAWCGCIVVVFGCIGCALLALWIVPLLMSCDSPNAVNFCQLLGF